MNTPNPHNPEPPEENPDASALIPSEDHALAPRNSGGTVRQTWNFSSHDVKANLSHCEPERRQILVDCFLWSINSNHPFTLADFAEAVGYDKTTITRLYTGKYTSHQTGARLEIPEKLAKSAREWLARQKKNFKGREGFVLTPTAKMIWTLANLARESQTVAFLIGSSHIGKTWALENYAYHNNHGATPYVRMEAAGGLGGMVKNIARSLAISEAGNTRDLVTYITKTLSPEMLLILDELHLLSYTYRKESFFSCLEVIREIHDKSGCGMVLCGTRLLMERIRPGQHSEMEQLVRRGPHKLTLPTMPTKADLTAILEAHQLPFPTKGDQVTWKGHVEQPYDLLRQLAELEGLLAISERLRYASKIALKSREDIDWKHFVAADLLIKSNSQPEPNWK